jgi:hypothetical protein
MPQHRLPPLTLLEPVSNGRSRCIISPRCARVRSHRGVSDLIRVGSPRFFAARSRWAAGLSLPGLVQARQISTKKSLPATYLALHGQYIDSDMGLRPVKPRLPG